ncbi:hypothetical protein FNU76_12135 [Chitinimonas arctica]|uniref:Uncharacterized protein n=1 Tax=Chitinimonas arctica TaxID=2594795 RepID=A0A516SFW4_9NEIS|nr:hypothetical protein [Chitinimonas arctica]QDQ27049.1 hypothetical protein FNU76_12135 [Chitinimonas arctica]
MLRRLVNRLLYSQEHELRSYEIACIVAFRNALDEISGAALDAQLARYDFIQRSPNGKHLAFFDADSDDKCSTWPASDLFHYKSPPVSAMRINFASAAFLDGKKRDFCADLFVMNGRLAGIEFEKAPPSTVKLDPLRKLEPGLLTRLNDSAQMIEAAELLIKLNSENGK